MTRFKTWLLISAHPAGGLVSPVAAAAVAAAGSVSDSDLIPHPE